MPVHMYTDQQNKISYPTSDCQVTLGAGSLAMAGKEKMAAWPAFTSRLSLAISENVVMSKRKMPIFAFVKKFFREDF